MRIILWKFLKEKGKGILQDIIFLLLNIKTLCFIWLKKQKIKIYNTSLFTRWSWWTVYKAFRQSQTLLRWSMTVDQLLFSALVRLSFSSSLSCTAKDSDWTKCFPLIDKPCMVRLRPTLIDLNPVELKYYPFIISLGK